MILGISAEFKAAPVAARSSVELPMKSNESKSLAASGASVAGFA